MQNETLPSLPEIWPVDLYHRETTGGAHITVRACPSGYSVRLDYFDRRGGVPIIRRTTDPRRVAILVRRARLEALD